jgi:hypothetical protein
VSRIISTILVVLVSTNPLGVVGAVLCFGSDGHIRIEQIVDPECCATASTSLTELDKPNGNSCGGCIDVVVAPALRDGLRTKVAQHKALGVSVGLTLTQTEPEPTNSFSMRIESTSVYSAVIKSLSCAVLLI